MSTSSAEVADVSNFLEIDCGTTSSLIYGPIQMTTFQNYVAQSVKTA